MINLIGKREVVVLLFCGLWLVYYSSWFVTCVLFAMVCDLCTVCHGLWLVYYLSWFVTCVLFAMVCDLCTVCHGL